MAREKKEPKIRTSITMDPVLLNRLRAYCEAQDISVSSFIERTVARALESESE